MPPLLPLAQTYTPLSSVTPDQLGNKSKLLALLAQAGTWTDQYTGGVGTTLIDMIASGVTYSQFEIERAVQECFPDTAQRILHNVMCLFMLPCLCLVFAFLGNHQVLQP